MIGFAQHVVVEFAANVKLKGLMMKSFWLAVNVNINVWYYNILLLNLHVGCDFFVCLYLCVYKEMDMGSIYDLFL